MESGPQGDADGEQDEDDAKSRTERTQVEDAPDICRFFSVGSIGVFYFPVGMAQYKGKFISLTSYPNSLF